MCIRDREKYRRTKRAQWWPGEGERAAPFPVRPRVPLGSLHSPIFFPFSPNVKPDPRLRHLLFFNAARKMKKCGNWLLISAWNWFRVFILKNEEKTCILAKFVQFATYLYGCFFIYLWRFPFVRTDRPGHSLRNENCIFNQSYPARSVKS